MCHCFQCSCVRLWRPRNQSQTWLARKEENLRKRTRHQSQHRQDYTNEAPQKTYQPRGPSKWGSRVNRQSGWWSRKPTTWLMWREWRKYSSNLTRQQQRGKGTGDCAKNWRRNAKNHKENRTAQSGSYTGTKSSTQPGFHTPHGMTDVTASR